MIEDTFGRPLGSLRVSVTDRCNLRCRYCMPEEEYVWLPRQSILTFEETRRLVGIFTNLGVSKVRITGGEPLMRQDLASLVAMLRENPAIADLAMTTNAVLLREQAQALAAAGLHRLTISLDTLRPERFRQFAGRARHDQVLAGIAAAAEAGFTGTKLNVVVMRGFNDDEVPELIAFGRDRGLEVRFIEYMDVGGATQWTAEDVVGREEILELIGRRWGRAEPVVDRAGAGLRAPADRYRLPDGTVFGVIASTTAPFCAACDRSRVTADGVWFLCLYGVDGVDLKEPMRSGATDSELEERIRSVWRDRSDRGAEERLGVAERGPLYLLQGLRQDPHREMHTRGG